MVEFVLPEVERLLAEAERGVRRLDRSAGTPVGFLPEQDSRTAEWIDEKDRERTILYSREDAGSPGELWLKGKHEAAIKRAERERDYKFRWCKARPKGYLKGGEPWSTTKTPHGHAAMYANGFMPEPPAKAKAGPKLLDDENARQSWIAGRFARGELTKDEALRELQHGKDRLGMTSDAYEAWMQSNEGAF
ncbi:MAG TPA: hypothetical protein VIZ91_07745 [Solirubrobacterales bacterium]